MFEDDGDIDDNGIPDSIQRDPVVERTPVVFGETPDEGLPGITAPIEATAEPLPEAPRAPTPPPDDADEATMLEYQMALQEYSQRMTLYTQMLTNISNMKHESLKGIAGNLRG